MKNIVTLFSKFFGIEQTPVSHAERIVSAIGGFIAILGIFLVSRWFVGSPGAGILVASMGASAVLLFAVPHGQLAQPWAVLGGHVVSAIIGVTCAQAIANEILAASAAVGLAVGAMYYLRCVHPPGGATALSAVIGGQATQALGYQYVITPVLINVVVILVIAFLYNYLFSWRRYPVYLQHSKQDQGEIPGMAEPGEISHGDFVYALSQIDSFVDVNEYDLLRIYELATHRLHGRHLNPAEISLGGYYSNGEHGDNWSVRQIVDESISEDSEKDMLIYKVVAGHDRRTSGCMTRVEFAWWARYRVVKDEENWERVPPE
jgi:CBS domain-containing membrane protein